MKRAVAVLSVIALLVATSAPSLAFSPPDMTGPELTDEELERIQGTWWSYVVTVGSFVLGWLGNEVVEHYDDPVENWLHEKAIPAVEDAVVEAYETTVTGVKQSGEFCSANQCAPLYW